MPRLFRKVLYYLLMVVITLGVAELLSYVAAIYLARKTMGLYFPGITEPYESYVDNLNPVLGWPSPRYRSRAPGYFDDTGARMSPAFPDPHQGQTCVSLYGDSYAEGEGVSHEDAWGNILATMLNCRVANYGMRGYGSDQAYLRYHHNHQDRAKIVILGHMTQNIARNINQLRNFLAPSAACHLKPRFIVNQEGRLELVAIPQLSREAYWHLEQQPGNYLLQEYYLPGGGSGIRQASFPYLLSVLRASGTIVRRLVRPEYWWELYEPGHPSRALQVTVALMKSFHDEARSRGQRPLVFILPTLGDLKIYRPGGSMYYQPLVAALRREHIELVDMTEYLNNRLSGQDPLGLFAPETNYHYSARGNKMIGEVAADYLTGKTGPATFSP